MIYDFWLGYLTLPVVLSECWIPLSSCGYSWRGGRQKPPRFFMPILRVVLEPRI